MEGSWEGIAGCMESVYVVGGCMLTVTKYPLFQLNALLKKSCVSTAILQSSSWHSQHAQNTAVYSLMKTAG